MYDLKKKKMLEKQLEGLQAKKLNLETQIMALESASTNKAVFDATVAGKNAMKQANAQMSVEKVDDIVDDLNDAMDEMAEVDDALAQPMGQNFDDDDLLAELDALDPEEEEDVGDLLKALDV